MMKDLKGSSSAASASPAASKALGSLAKCGKEPFQRALCATLEALTCADLALTRSATAGAGVKPKRQEPPELALLLR